MVCFVPSDDKTVIIDPLSPLLSTPHDEPAGMSSSWNVTVEEIVPPSSSSSSSSPTLMKPETNSDEGVKGSGVAVVGASIGIETGPSEVVSVADVG